MNVNITELARLHRLELLFPTEERLLMALLAAIELRKAGISLESVSVRADQQRPELLANGSPPNSMTCLVTAERDLDGQVRRLLTTTLLGCRVVWRAS